MYVAVRFGWQFASVTWTHALAYGATLMLSLYVLAQLYSAAQPTFQNNQLVSAGTDLKGEGVVQYMFDLIYVTWATHLLSLVTDYAWFLYLTVLDIQH